MVRGIPFRSVPFSHPVERFHGVHGPKRARPRHPAGAIALRLSQIATREGHDMIRRDQVGARIRDMVAKADKQIAIELALLRPSSEETKHKKAVEARHRNYPKDSVADPEEDP